MEDSKEVGFLAIMADSVTKKEDLDTMRWLKTQGAVLPSTIKLGEYG
jgi:hypothetical protein